jgi:hypothetical protein
MQKIKKLHRATYTGENVISEMTYSDGGWNKTIIQTGDALGSLVLRGSAAVLGNGSSRNELNPHLLNVLKNHSDLTVYGCNAIMRDAIPDFVCANDEMLAEFIENGYCDQTVIYGTAKMCEQYPDKFYYVPQNPNWNMGAIAAYLACFDGHKTVYLIGHDLHTQEIGFQMNVYSGTRGYPNTHSLTTEHYFEHAMKQVMDIYDDVDFVRVAPTKDFYMPESWKYQLNLRQISFKEFVIEADLG